MIGRGLDPIIPGPTFHPTQNDLIWFARDGNEWAMGKAPRPPLLPTSGPLTPDQLARGHQEGERRHHRAMAAGFRDRYGFKGDSLAIHIQGAIGELAAAIALGVPWEPDINGFHNAGHSDVAGYEVKTTGQDHYDLNVWPDARLTEAFILVTLPNYRVVGWIDARSAMRPEHLKQVTERPASYFVPQRLLRPLPTAPIPWPGG